MPLFDVPGWGMPADMQPTSSSNPRKRKRPGAGGEGSSDMLQTAEINLQKLMKRLGTEGQPPEQKMGKKKAKGEVATSGRAGQKKKAALRSSGGAIEAISPQKSDAKPPSPRRREKPKSKSKHQAKEAESTRQTPKRAPGSHDAPQTHSRDGETPRNLARNDKKSKKHDRKSDAGSRDTEKLAKGGEGADTQLTSLQAKMKHNLEGARFRWINETLYKSNSKDAERLMREDPKVFDEYHEGFRHQVTSWPANPVEYFVRTLSPYPARSVIVDLGCGDATLAQELVPRGFTVLSYDLVSANPYITAVDICERLPLPGAEDKDEGQVVDVVVCSLSLMSTNWLNCIREAKRVLKTGGELKIAEVASRFTSVDKFTSLISSIGFRLVSQNDENTHFTLFDFRKAGGSRSLDEKAWEKILSKGDILQPCEYKRR